MTHSGQGDDGRPAARPTHEGVVLPSDGSAPWAPPGAHTPDPQPTDDWWDQPVSPGPGDATQLIPPVGAGPLPPQMPGPGDATQVIPPVVGAGPLPPQMPGPADATQVIPPVPSGAGDATQVIPPVGAGPLPPQSHPGSEGPATRVLPPVPAGPVGPAGGRPVPPPPPGAPYGIRPGAPGDTPVPPAEFDGLFRAGERPPPAGPAGTAPGPRSRRRDRRRARRRSTVGVPVIAAVVVGCAVLGLGVSAVLFGGEDDDGGPARDTAPAVSAAPTDAPPSPKTPAEDPVRTQAQALDRLLADSNDSRAAVIRSVENIKRCTELSRAATDLRAAAEQRRSLVTRLDGLALDRLPGNEDLTEALSEAWEASAEADDHYAAWAEQVTGRKGCRKGKARVTPRAREGNEASAEATESKREAARLWNPVATDHSLPQRRADQL
ncbi:hypothetical protein ABT354_12155 [Streptomyces sp. NPDC000594]|uniref:hypothetical protein n=1 Tax=Streptomyces sp. NPDC000594 TaxID=3154261 RepID=UPI003320E82E